MVGPNINVYTYLEMHERVFKNKKSFAQEHDMHILLPHELFSAMYHKYKAAFFEHVVPGGKQVLIDFWNQVKGQQDILHMYMWHASCTYTRLALTDTYKRLPHIHVYAWREDSTCLHGISALHVKTSCMV